MNNLSTYSAEETANTNPECARQRAENLAIMGARSVLELCVGPSLRALEKAYADFDIQVTGNDIDLRWPLHYPNGRWLVGDALAVDWRGFDAVVFAPPLSAGCSGRREDALMINKVSPGYRAFMKRPHHGIRCMVLPARALATPVDRGQLHALLAAVQGADVVPLTAGARKIRKYVDVYWKEAARVDS